ncbi:hypothetical protein ACFV7R_46130, partial [Streptomyces sp. NPDC059866]
MRVQHFTLAAAGAALLATTVPTPVHPDPDFAIRHQRTTVSHEGAVTAADLLAEVSDCTPVSSGRYRTDRDTPATVPVCGTRDAVFWKADMDIDCDGRPGIHCNSATDPYFLPSTAFQQSDGRYLDAEDLPYVVVPMPSGLWNYRDHGVRGGSVVGVVLG